MRVRVREQALNISKRNAGVLAEMRNRRFAQIATSDDEDDFAPQSQQSSDEIPSSMRKRKLKRLAEESEEGDEEVERHRSKKKKKGEEEKEEAAETASEGEEEEEEEELEAKPIGELVKISGKGRTRRHHYQAFEYDGNQYELVSCFSDRVYCDFDSVFL